MEESPGSGSFGRRSFLNTLISSFLFLFFVLSLYPILSYLWPRKGGSLSGGPITIPLDSIPRDGYRVVNYREGKLIVVRSGNRVIALSAACTHLACTLKYNRKGFIECPCHNGKFDLNGTVIAGPPPKPLASYPVRIVRERIIIGG